MRQYLSLDAIFVGCSAVRPGAAANGDADAYADESVLSSSIDWCSQGQGLCLSYLRAYSIKCGQTASVTKKVRMAIVEP